MQKGIIPFNEYFLHYVWRTKQIDARQLTTTTGKPLQIIHFGQYNEDAGPDFLHATVEIDGTTWVGHIEIHVLSSDWEKHRHQTDKAYNNVILHVVYFDDKKVNDIPTLSLYHRIPKILIQRYHQLVKCNSWVPCAPNLKQVPDSVFNLWKDGLLVEKIENKETRIFQLLERYTNDWESCFYVLLARHFGGKVNDIAFEALAERTSLEWIRKNNNEPMMVQALLFGQAGLLATTCQDDYVVELKSQFNFLKQKYNLNPLDPVVWKLSKLRPPNFPTIRLAEFSTLKNLGNALFYAMMESRSVQEMYELLDGEVHEYWSNHYLFGIQSPWREKNISRNFKDILIMNAFLPLALCFAKVYGDEARKQKVLQMYEDMKPEKNKISLQWKTIGMPCETAMDTQALLHLYTSYCQKKRCLSCKIGHQLLVKKTV